MKHQDFETTASQSSLPNSGHSIRERNQHSVMQEIEERKDIKGNYVVLETMLRRRTKKKKKNTYSNWSSTTTPLVHRIFQVSNRSHVTIQSSC